MNFSFQRHLRTAGSVAAIVGILLQNWYVVLFGWTIVALGYMVALAKIEAYIEVQSEQKEEENENALR